MVLYFLSHAGVLALVESFVPLWRHCFVARLILWCHWFLAPVLWCNSFGAVALVYFLFGRVVIALWWRFFAVRLLWGDVRILCFVVSNHFGAAVDVVSYLCIILFLYCIFHHGIVSSWYNATRFVAHHVCFVFIFVLVSCLALHTICWFGDYVAL